MGSQYALVQRRSILTVLKDSLSDRPSWDGRDMSENEVRYKLIIDPSEDDSLIRLLFSLGVLDRQNTRMYVCSDFPGDSQIQKVCFSPLGTSLCYFVMDNMHAPYPVMFNYILLFLSPSRSTR